jgi:YHS domain-containing protein
MKTLIISIIISMVGVITGCSVQAQDQVKGKVQSSYVCYVNNKYMGKEQIPVEVNGKTYYGCCQMCVGKLQNNEEVRTAIDPLTDKEVDKATAYIVIKDLGKSDVLYFENKNNYEKFKKSKNL